MKGMRIRLPKNMRNGRRFMSFSTLSSLSCTVITRLSKPSRSLMPFCSKFTTKKRNNSKKCLLNLGIKHPKTLSLRTKVKEDRTLNRHC